MLPSACRGGTRACCQPTAGCMGSRTGGSMGECKRRCPRCRGISGSGCSTPRPCSPPAAVGWGERQVSMRSLAPMLQQWVLLWKRKRGATVTLWPGESPSRRNPRCQLPARGVLAQLTFAAARALPGCPSCLVGAGLGEQQRWLWGRVPLRAAQSSSESTTQHRGSPNSTLQSSHRCSDGGEAQTAGLSCCAQI